MRTPPIVPYHLVPYDIGCEPSPSGACEVVIRTQAQTFVTFYANSCTLAENGLHQFLGVAVVECIRCCKIQTGFPNDDSRASHPHFQGPWSPDTPWTHVVKVLNSPWKVRLKEELDTADRIDQARYGGELRKVKWGYQHFIIKFKDSTFECMATKLKVIGFTPTMEAAWTLVKERAWEQAIR